MKSKVLLLTAVIFGIFGCSEYDDSGIVKEIDDIKKRLDAVEKTLSELNKDIVSISSAVDALETMDFIDRIVDSDDGYTIHFHSGKTIVIRHGKNGTDSNAPIIGIDMHTDGIYYWTITTDGTKKWLEDGNGNKMPVTGRDGQDGGDGKDGITPVLGVDSDGYWTVDYGEGASRVLNGEGSPVSALGKDGQAGDSYFKDVDASHEDHVVLTLTDGTEIVIPKYKGLSIRFDHPNPVKMFPSDTLEVKYYLTGSDENTKIEAIVAKTPWAVNVKPSSISEGTLEIISGTIAPDSRILVFVSDGKGSTVMEPLYLEDATIFEIDTKEIHIGREGGSVSFQVTANFPYSLNFSSDGNWVTILDTRSVKTDTINLFIEPNYGFERETTIMIFRTKSRLLVGSLKIYQES